jgi:hypothetical protein
MLCLQHPKEALDPSHKEHTVVHSDSSQDIQYRAIATSVQLRIQGLALADQKMVFQARLFLSSWYRKEVLEISAHDEIES